MDIIEFIVDSVLIFVAVQIGLSIVGWWLHRRIHTELDKVSNELELEQLIPLTVEVVDHQYFCYNSITQDFVCQGGNLKDIVKKFKQRYPDKSAAIYNGDETAVRTLKLQLKDLDENSSGIGSTS